MSHMHFHALRTSLISSWLIKPGPEPTDRTLYGTDLKFGFSHASYGPARHCPLSRIGER